MQRRDLRLLASTWLGASLVEYMVPGSRVELERLPRTASGKVDWRSLPELEVAYQAAMVLGLLPA